MKRKSLTGLFVLFFAIGILFTSCSDDGEESNGSVPADIEITTFSFQASLNDSLEEDVIADISGYNIYAEVPYNTVVTAFVASFKTTGTAVTVDGSPQENGITANDFSSDIKYTVTGKEGTSTVYTVTVNIAEKTISTKHSESITASDPDIEYEFGDAMAISGDYAIIGDYTHEDYTGAAYVYKLDGEEWTYVQRLVALDAKSGDHFGSALVINGNYAVTGAYRKDTGEDKEGVAYIFELGENGLWTETQMLQASDSQALDYFGSAVSISGDYIFVSAGQEDGGVDDQGNDVAFDAGAVYVFHRGQDGICTETQILHASDLEPNDYFGANAVSVSGEYAVIGAYKEDLTGNYNRVDAGAAYIFKLGVDGQWTETQKISASDAYRKDYFGSSVFINGNTIIIGATGEDAGVNSEGTMNAYNAGAAYVFQLDENGVWSETQILYAPDFQPQDEFGTSISMHGEFAVIASLYEDGGEGDPVTDAGTAYVYRVTSDGTWTEDGILRASDAAENCLFGKSAAISDTGILVGAPDCYFGAGAAYFFKFK